MIHEIRHLRRTNDETGVLSFVAKNFLKFRRISTFSQFKAVRRNLLSHRKLNWLCIPALFASSTYFLYRYHQQQQFPLLPICSKYELSNVLHTQSNTMEHKPDSLEMVGGKLTQTTNLFIENAVDTWTRNKFPFFTVLQASSNDSDQYEENNMPKKS